MKLKQLSILLFLLSIVLLTGCQPKQKDNPIDETPENPNPTDYTPTHKATIEMTNGGLIVLELYGEIAPITVNNFEKLANEKFYDGLIFHRVIIGFMIQGGDPNGNGTGGPDYTIKGEFKANGVNNPISHERGVISMARSNEYDSAGSQFFIMHKTSTHLDDLYAAFGKVVEGMDVVDEIASVPVNYNNKPYLNVVIKTIRVEKVAQE
jgi:peptidyl-prolyl cis-trans isomerase B (cyclophilin B)